MKLSSIDLYSGIGGWTLGMKMSGVEPVKSFEWNPDSNRTHNLNFSSSNKEVDIRSMDWAELPKPGEIDIVVGSPPCTQFSFSNRGGNGDIEDGLVDMHRFLSIVEYLKPKFWAMENVPRVKGIFRALLDSDERFKRFRPLVDFIEVVDCSDYGLPQRRRRMIAGNFPWNLFETYSHVASKMTLGQVVESLRPTDSIRDPNYGFTVRADEITDHILETPLSGEELRVNREAKTFHPVYNAMSFPEDINKPSRTITSTCTRVSRESLVIYDEHGYRRLTVRERACLMGFPITYNLYGNSFSSKLKMIGNAIPPVLTYYIFQAMKGVPAAEVGKPILGAGIINDSLDASFRVTSPDSSAKKFRKDRAFRMAVPGLRFGSGVRFELSNRGEGKDPMWSVRFFYGTSKKIEQLEMNSDTFERVHSHLSLSREQLAILKGVRRDFDRVSIRGVQERWAHLDNEGIHPFELLDLLGRIAEKLRVSLDLDSVSDSIIEEVFGLGLNKKLYERKGYFLAGVLTGLQFNLTLDETKVCI